MKKRLISLLLILGTLLAVFPVAGVAAEEVLPKDETPGEPTGTVSENPALNAYDMLYVGADGSKTANGGELVAYYTALREDVSSVNLTAKTWSDKLGKAPAATLIGNGWTTYAEGGFGYTYAYSDFKRTAGNYGLSLPEELLSPDLTVETLARVKTFLEADGTVLNVSSVTFNTSEGNDASFTRIDALGSVFFIGMPRTGDCEKYAARWFLSYHCFSKFYNGGAAYPSCATDSVYHTTARSNGLKPVLLTAQYMRSTDAAGTETYTISYPTSGSITFTATAEQKAALVSAKSASKDKAKPLSFFNGIPSDVYSIRVYSAALTTSEKNQNAAADILAYAGADLTDYLSLIPASREIVNGILAVIGVIESKDAANAKVAETLHIFKNQIKLEDTLYVQDGLTFFASAYKYLSTGHTMGGGNINWVNAVNPTETASLRGGYTVNANGGYTIEKTYAEFNAAKNYGIYMPETTCPQGDYTVELVFNPVGLSTRNDKGELERYIDEVSPNGVYNPYANGNAIGPLRGLQFICYRPGSAGAQMERRWGYFASGAMYEKPTNRPTVTDKAWGNVGLYEVVIMGITHERTKEGGANYNFYHNAVQSASTMEILPENYIAPSAAGNMFQLMVSMPGTAFSIRVYNRTLTEAEMAQNKLADLAYYFGLDVSRVLELADMMGEASSHLYKSLENLSFNMAQEDAQRVLDNYVAATWLSFDTVGVRKGDADYTRYYFTCNPAAVIAMVGVGYTVEMGALINVGKNVAPTLEGDAYDYRLNMYGSASGRNSAFYVDEDTFGVTVRYTDTDKAAGLANVFVRGYIKMTDENGEVTIYYADASAEIAKQDNLFKLYDSMLSNAGLRSDAGTLNRMRTVIEKCYTTQYVYVDAAAEAGGNGSADAPYRSFASGFAACKDILSKNGIPLRLVMMLADGEYGIYETQELSDTDIAYKYTSFEITSESGKSTLTTTKEIDTPFEKYSSYIWVTQLEKEEDGSYPCFRYLYVDGEIADLAYNGGRYTADTVTKYVSGYERTYDGPWGKAYEKYKNKSLTKDTKSGYPASRRDLDALFEKYKKGFLALREAETKFNAGGMTPATECDDTTDAEYVAYFNQFKLRILVLADMKKQYSRLDGTPTQNYQDFIKYSAKDFDDSAYRTEYETVRTHISKNLDQLSLSSFDTYNAMVESDAMADSKYYLREELVGDLHDAIAAGKARNEAALKALEEKYAASDANTQALLQPELEKARLKTGEYTWFRYALEDCGPEMYQAGQWWHNIVHVNGVDYDDYVIDSSGKKHVAVYMEPEEYKNFFIHKTYVMTGRYVFMKNALAYVDSQDEYYYDEPTGKLYYYWAGDISDKSFERATSDYMLYFKNADNITVSGLRITGLDDAYLSHNDGCVSLGNTGGAPGAWDRGSEHGFTFDRAAIVFDSGNNLAVYDCDFAELGTRGIFGRHMLKNVTIEDNTFTRLGAGAIHLGAGGEQRTYSEGKSEFENIAIINNYVHDIAREYYSSFGIFTAFGKNVEILHNTVTKCSYSAIGLGLYYSFVSFDPTTSSSYHIYNAEIAYNYVGDFMQQIGDGGGIYVTGASADKTITGYMNYLHDNYVLFTKDTGNALNMVCGLYFDGAASNWHVYNNVIVQQSYGAYSGEGDGTLDAEYLQNMRKRRYNTYLIYLQRIASQFAYNILCENNYILNVRATDPEAQKDEVFRRGSINGVEKSLVDPTRNLEERSTHYIKDVSRIPIPAEEIIYAAGAPGYEGMADDLWNNDY